MSHLWSPEKANTCTSHIFNNDHPISKYIKGNCKRYKMSLMVKGEGKRRKVMGLISFLNKINILTTNMLTIKKKNCHALYAEYVIVGILMSIFWCRIMIS